MSMLPMGGIVAGAAGTGLAQTTGSDVARAKQDATAQQTRQTSAAHANDAAGIGKTDGEDNATDDDRDADGRMSWQREDLMPPRVAADDSTTAQPHASKDASGQSGNQLDLTG